jgi:hypothetical protein
VRLEPIAFKNLQELIRSLGVNPEKGLTDQETTIRLNQYGENSLATSLPLVQAALQISNLHLGDWPLIIGLSFAATFWMELEKILRKNT